MPSGADVRAGWDVTITDLEALLEKATAGPWRPVTYGNSHAADIIGPEGMVAGEAESDCACMSPADARLIVALRNAAPDLIACVNLLREVANMRQPTPGNWPGEPVLPGWQIARIDAALAKVGA